MPLKKFALAVLASILISTFCLSKQNNQPMTNQDVTAMVSAGFSDGVIVDKIRTSATNFDTSVDALKTLQAAKVSDAVMRAMINPKPFADAATSSSDFNDPASPHDPGIYMYTKTSDGMKMTLLEPTTYHGSVNGGQFVFSFGIAKAKVKAVVDGQHANIKSDDGSMTFYFYFDPSAGFSSGWGTPSSPNEFSLLRFDEKKDSRETVLASVSAFHATTGDKKANNTFTFVRVKAGVYKVTPNAPLTTGEYCFVAPSAFVPEGYRLVENNRLFDFSVLPQAQPATASLK